MNEGKRCSVCKREWNEVNLREGISGAEMVMICDDCSVKEGIPTIKKPTGEQIQKGKERKSVRERMERLSGVGDSTEISKDQESVQRNLHRLKSPIKKETNPFVVDNHYWIANMGRRRKKLTVTQAAEAMGITSQVIEETEHGKIPENFEEVFNKMEKLYGIKLLIDNPQKVHYVKSRKEEEKILKEVEEKMVVDKKVLKEIGEEKSGPAKEQIKKGELDFSDKEALREITLNDLVEMKNKKKRVDEAKRIRSEVESMIGEDLELDFDELEED